ncbi:hypothetical protein E1B28_002981 [Marasmius oreades]|uniref:Uncharacterized protein n=1 Tax=Marasmius oreades TaxID=181124 RepID=A0A9P7RLL2_9AGAR|nr:uncharacterized protein E1B28_002981 [Marasmius oreades]KAG7085420.1 hypothetical protein E1B28_002981 [Marasmius oreades]
MLSKSTPVPPIVYRPGHFAGDGCIQRAHPTIFHYNDPVLGHVREPAVAVNFYLKHDLDFREKLYSLEYAPGPGYQFFATLFNNCVDNFKFADWDYSYKRNENDPNDKSPILYLDKPSPPPELFGVELHQCVEGEILLPGHVSVPRTEYEQLSRLASLDALRVNKFRNRAFRERAERKAYKQATQFGVGGFGYVDPVAKAKLEKAKGREELLHGVGQSSSSAIYRCRAGSGHFCKCKCKMQMHLHLCICTRPARFHPYANL